MEVLERLIGAVRRCCEGFPDPRWGDNGSYAMADFGLAAFSVFFAQSPSFLAHQRQLAAGHGRSNAHTLFGMSRIPGDSHIRRMLDPVAPDHLFPVFDEVIGDLERSGGLAAFQRLGSRVLIALDGTEYHRSTKIHCPHARFHGGGACLGRRTSSVWQLAQQRQPWPLNPLRTFIYQIRLTTCLWSRLLISAGSTRWVVRQSKPCARSI